MYPSPPSCSNCVHLNQLVSGDKNDAGIVMALWGCDKKWWNNRPNHYEPCAQWKRKRIDNLKLNQLKNN